MRLLLAVEEAAGLQTFKLAEKSDHEIVAVLSSPTDEKRGATVSSVAAKLGYEVLNAKLVKDPQFAKYIEEKQIDMLLNVHSLYIIHADILNAVKLGAFNLHPGPLPEYAGMNAANWAILNNEAQHGVTLHWMEAGIDTGHIAYQTRFDLTTKDTGLSVSTRCVKEGLKLIENLLNTPSASVPKLEQNFSERKYYGFEVPFAGKVDWSLDAKTIERFVRASNFYPLPSPWGTPLTTDTKTNETVGILKVALTGNACSMAAGSVSVIDDSVFVATSTDWLELKKVIVDGKVRAAKEVLTHGQQLH